MQFTVEFQADHLTAVMEVIRQEVATPQQMLGSIGETLYNANQHRHAQGLAPDGSPWKPLAPMTLANRRGSRMLYGHGDMLGSFNYQVQGNNLRLGFSDQKAVWHHDGTRPYVIIPKKAKALAFAGMFRKRVNHPGLPSRKLVGFPASDQQLTGELIQDHLTLVLNRVRRPGK
ncbi:phage virion morphogenesis protein [Herbaspirillum sp.]|uniref:phage virion morphogenesis protein n=1 Tax=Herbaspirillum sp. TaxID=1890675 RepID=UPI001B0A645A|nr:phage virion morphogenesis protein [Herbaspirillum sp.]MBO9538733.1 phage virion morphogenesis protein [Herbaspirillum sp.]